MRSYYKGVARDQYGAIIGGATIAIYLAGTTTVASVYTVSIGGTAVNSVTADVEGVFYFYVDTSDYSNIQLFKLVISYLGNTATYDNIVAFYNDNYYIDALGEYGSGTAYTQATIEAALTAIGTTNKATMLLRPGTWAVTTDLTIPANVTLKIPAGAVLSIATGKTLTINGPLDAGLYQVFDCVGTGKVVCGAGSVAAVYPVWWGAKRDGVTDDLAAISAAAASLTSGGTIRFSPGTYAVNGTVSGIALLSDTNAVLDKGAIINVLPNNLVSYAIFYLNSVHNVSISGGELIGDRATHTGVTGEWGNAIWVTASTDISIKDIEIHGFWGDGIYLGEIDGSNSSWINLKNIKSYNNRRNGLTVAGVDNLLVEQSSFYSQTGTSPEAGIDLEPNTGHTNSKLTFFKVKSYDNSGYALAATVLADASTARTSDTTFIDCDFEASSTYYVMYYMSNGKNTFINTRFKGPINDLWSADFDGCTFYHSTAYTIMAYGILALNNFPVSFTRCIFNAVGTPFIYIQGSGTLATKKIIDKCLFTQIGNTLADGSSVASFEGYYELTDSYFTTSGTTPATGWQIFFQAGRLGYLGDNTTWSSSYYANNFISETPRTFEWRDTLTWDGTHEAQYFMGNIILMNAKYYIESITYVVTGAAGNIIIGDEATGNRYVTSVALANGVGRYTLANNVWDGSHVKILVDPSINLTGTITLIIKGIKTD
jgi:hypothetical protein